MKSTIFIFTFHFISCGFSGTKNNGASEKMTAASYYFNNPDSPLFCLFVNLPKDMSSKMAIADNADE